MFAHHLPPQRSYTPSAEHLLSHTYPPPTSFTPPNLSPNFSQGLLAQQALARFQKASPEGTIPSVNSSINSHRSSELSNVSTNLSNSLLSTSGSLGSPCFPAQQSPATMSRPVCRYWHSGRCLYGAHCRFASPACCSQACCCVHTASLYVLGRVLSSRTGLQHVHRGSTPATLSFTTSTYELQSCIRLLTLGMVCRFAHPAGPAPTPPPSVQPVCRYWRFGTCRYGSACRFRLGLLCIAAVLVGCVLACTVAQVSKLVHSAYACMHSAV